MKTIYKISTLIIALALILSSCSKDDENVTKSALVTFLKGKVEASTPATKTQHEYSDKTLKVSWSAGDQIAVADGNKLYKFTQTGELSADGHTAMFTTETPVTFGEGEIIAVYPYTADLTYDLSSQAGTIDKLFQTDLLLARAQVSATAVEDLEFNPLCAVMRLPKDILVTDEDYSGDMNITVSGSNLGGKVFISKTGGIDVQEESVTVPVSISNGKFAEDAFIVFVPREKTGTFSYTLETDRNDAYSFSIENISTSKVYSVKTIFNGIVVFEDENFKKYCVENFDLDGDGEISFAEARKVKKMEFRTDENHLNISSLKGIEAFKNLTFLKCGGYLPSGSNIGKLTSLDVSKNTALEELYCLYNQLTSLDVSKNTALTYLECSSNQLSSLNVSKNTALKTLYCGYNQFTSLDVSKNTALKTLHCLYNQLTSLDVSKNTALKTLYCDYNQLTSLDISKNTALEELYCQNNQLTSLDVSKNTALTRLYCNVNKLTSLDVSKNTALIDLECNNNQFTSLDVSKNTSLTYLYCFYNQLTSLDVSKNTALKTLYCYYNQLSSLNVSGCAELKTLYCYYNQLTSLDVSKNTALTYLYCDFNQLTSLDVSGCTALQALRAWPQKGILSTLYIKKGQSINYGSVIPSSYGTNIIQVD